MIRMLFCRVDGKIRAFRIRGHAGQAAYGSDVVCAAVSVLSQAITNGLMQAKVPVAYSMADGRLEVCIRPKTLEQIRAADLLTDTLFLGLSEIAAANLPYVRLKETVWR